MAVMTPEQKREQEKATVGLMIELYCRGNHGTRKGQLCPDCAALREYADARVDHCPHMATKTFCSVCKTHCYKPEMREHIRQVMRWSGPRMLFHHPVLAVRHLMEKKSRRKHNKALQAGRGEMSLPFFLLSVGAGHARPGTFPVNERPRTAAGGVCPAPTVDL